MPTRRSLKSAEDRTLAEVIVTGTRLNVTQSDSIAPVTVLDRRDVERSGADSVGKIVRVLPMNTGSPIGTNVNNGGDGAARVDLRGLGSQRTLVLLNGRRFPNGGVGGDASVDLNMLPVSWIERIEVLASGASAVYGADAVGGVVNVITRTDVEGAEFGGGWTITERGDGEIVRGDALVGFDLFGGSWSIGVDYTKQDGVSLARRDYSAAPLETIDANGGVGFVGNLAIPEGLFDVPEENALGLEPGFYTRVTGAAGQTAADYRPFTERRRIQLRAVQLFANAQRAHVRLAARLGADRREARASSSRRSFMSVTRARNSRPRRYSLVLAPDRRSRTGRRACRRRTTTTRSAST